jgi:hypothetical protein
VDQFVTVLGISGLILLALAVIVLVSALIDVFKKRASTKGLITSLVIFLVTCGFGLAFASIALFVYTFSRFTHEERIGYVVAEAHEDTIAVTFCDETKDMTHSFKLTGEQWMVEGYIMRWSTSLRWLGAESYFLVTRFSGRDVAASSSVYQIAPETGWWRFLLKNCEKIPFVDAAYGIGAFQYPSADRYYLYINDTGFIIKKE